MIPFAVHRPEPAGEPALPLVVHVPHSSLNVPASYRADFVVTDGELQTELLAMTDRYTDALAASATRVGGTSFVNTVSRLVMDPERFADDAAEPMARRGMGAIYVSRHDGRALRRADFSVADRSRVIAELYTPYHQALERVVSEQLEARGCSVIVDLHSFPREALAYEDASLARPHVCIGFDEEHVDEMLRDRWAAEVRDKGLEVGFNTPFSGSLVPTAFWRREPRVRSLMIEVRRDLYMEETGERSTRFGETLALVTALLRMAAERARELCVSP